MPTSTLHPLPFENLEPKRFEDLVRQLAYDFRRWRMLEATGRSGSDEGFDARGLEIVDGERDDLEAPADEPDADPGDGPTSDRLWLIQCKREREIGPKKMVAHLNALPPESVSGLYGVLFVASSDLSKAARDAGRAWCRDRGVQETYIWGRAELEDQLFQPKNDHLLFAYFGFSLQIRRRNAGSQLRRTTTLKRKIKRLIPGAPWPGSPIIVRDPGEEHYPYVGDHPLPHPSARWWPTHSLGIGLKGLRVLLRCAPAYYDRETGEWDIASAKNQVAPWSQDNPWADDESAQETEVMDGWRRLPRETQAWLMIVPEIAYHQILEIDELGDSVCATPVVFADFPDGQLPIAAMADTYFSLVGLGARADCDRTQQVQVFPDRFKDLDWERGWRARNGLGPLASDRREVPLRGGGVWSPDRPPPEEPVLIPPDET